MPRRKRIDTPGSFLHITNRGIAKRVLMEDREDARYLMSCMAWAVRRSGLAIHVFSLMPTHFHILGQSLDGDVASSMQLMQGRYARYFNRKYRRDGPLFRGRYFSKPVDSLTYRYTLVRYVDMNPVQARLVRNPWDHPYGSAVSYVHGPERPWLTTSWVKRAITRPNEEMGIYEPSPYSGAAYIKRFGRRSSDYLCGMVERRMSVPYDGPDELDHLVNAAPARVRSWMQRKATLADGGRLGVPLVESAAVEAALVGWPDALDLPFKSARGVAVISREVARVGLARQLVGVSWSSLSRKIDRPEATCRRLYERHERAIVHDPLYADAAAEAARRALDFTFVPGGRS